MTTVPDTKTCTRCRQIKPLGEFPRDRSKRYGVHTACKACRSAHNVEYYAENRDYYAAYHAANADKISERKAQYRASKPHVTWEAAYRRRALAKGVDPRVESFTRDQLIARWGDACAHCGGPFEELDHYPISIAQGGAHSLDNCRPSCSDCNHRSWRKAEHDAIPETDGPEDDEGPHSVGTPSERVSLDGGHADLEVIDQHVEVTVTLGARASIGLALTADEAARIGAALTTAAHRAHVVQAAQIDLEGVETVTDLLHRSRETGVPMAALIEQVGR